MSRCTHPSTIEGGDRPPGVWCMVCGAKLPPRHLRRRETRLDKAAREQKQAQQIGATMRELAAKSRFTS